MKSLLARIPETYRRLFYCLPLLIHWIIALTWEDQASVRRPARRSMILSLLFLTGISILYFFRETVAYWTSGSLDYPVGWIAFAGHIVLAVAYWLGSLFIIAQEALGLDTTGRLDALADMLEGRLSK